MPFKLRPWEFNIIVFSSVCSLALCLFAAVYFNLERHDVDSLDYSTNSTSYNKMVNSIQSLNYSSLTYSEYIAQTNSIFTVYFNSMQKDHDAFLSNRSSTSYKLYTASRAVAYSLNGVLAIPVFYMFFTCSRFIGVNLRAKRKNIVYYRNYWFGIVSFFVGLGLLAGSFYAYGKEQTQNGVGLFIAGELIIIAGCYVLREYVPKQLPAGYVESEEEIAENRDNKSFNSGQNPGEIQYGSSEQREGASAPFGGQ